MQQAIAYRPFPLLLAALFVVGSGVSGCGPSLTPEDLGTVETKVPKLPGSEGPYPMPELEPAADSKLEATPKPVDLVPKPPSEPDAVEKK